MENFENISPVSKPAQEPKQLSKVAEKTPQAMAMDSILQRVPPIEGLFNPDEEVQRLWLVPKEQRKDALIVFKDTLSRQREAWALCRTTIEEKIEANPDIPKQELVGIIGQFASSYGFAGSHISTAERLIDDYIVQHKRVREIREEYPDDVKLVNRLTKMKFNTADAKDFDVKVGPMSIEISCSGFNADRIYGGSKDPVVGSRYGGFASQSRDKKPVYYLVINKDFIENPAFYSIIVPHEREHQKNKILSPKLYGQSGVRADVRERLNWGTIGFLRHQIGERLLGFERKLEDEVFERYESTKNPEEKAFLLGEYMRLRRENALNNVKDEIIAMKKEPNFTREAYNIFLKQDGGAYDYLKYLRDWDKKKGDPLWQETSKRVFIDEYRDIIDSAIAAFDRLKGEGYSQAEIIAALSDKRLSEWSKTVRRLSEARREETQAPQFGEFDLSYHPSAVEIYDTSVCQSLSGKRMVFDRSTKRIYKIINGHERPANESEIAEFSLNLLDAGLTSEEVGIMRKNLSHASPRFRRAMYRKT
ncbi:MAG: hypothetical protein HY425_03610 [Candidatus Levybacteria bacterium]|nr:hypothetical protein [Candidatus Levybacteria bacterium]